MPVSVLQGDPLELFFASQTLGSAAGRTIPLNNTVWWAFVSSHIVLVTTATVGGRALVFQALDVAGNVLWETTGAGGAPASTTTRYQLGADVIASGINQNISLNPTPFGLFPPGSSFKIFDAGNTDANDTFSGNLIITT